MAKISFHNGPKVSLEHNRRNPKVVTAEEHIDLSRVHENWIDCGKFKDTFNDIFADSIMEYNVGRRKDRQIDNMYNHVKKKYDKNPEKAQKLVYEAIIGVYPEEGEHITIATARAVLKKYVDEWTINNPNLILIGAYYHADEQGEMPHVHLDYVPLARGYKKGPSEQPGLTKALQQQGVETDKVYHTEQQMWQNVQREVLSDICKEYEIDVNLEVQEKRQHEEQIVYKLQKEVATLKRERENMQEVSATEIQSAITRKGVFGSKDYTKVKTSELNVIMDELRGYREQKQAYAELIKETEAEKKSAKNESARASAQAEQSKELNAKLQKELKIANMSASDEKKYIRDGAKKLFNQLMDGQDVKSDRMTRMEQYMDKIPCKDGKSLLEHFNEAERVFKSKLKEKFDKGMDIQEEIDEEKDNGEER